MIKYLWLKINVENAFSQRERGVHTTITPTKLHVVLQTKDSPALSVFCFADSSIKLMVECIDETSSSGGAGGV